MKSKYLDLFKLTKKTIYVVGGLGLLGEEAVKALASCGAKVIVLDIQAPKAVQMCRWAKARGLRIFYHACDVGDLDHLSENLKYIVAQRGIPDVWINASYPRSKDWARPLAKMTLAYVRENVDKHLNSYLWSAREVALMMKAARVQGRIIHFASIYGVVANDLSIYEGTPMFGEMTYCAIKSGIIHLTRYLASHFGRQGIRANSICPGGIFDHQNSRFVKNYERKVPLGRMGNPRDVAAAVVFLASDASSYMTGAVLMIDGGWTAA